ncbi:precorrin-3B synthase [Paracoccus sp. Z330]|uniref:Precorrin-3B synthase n=1 Tax=Paracoccus onchidii TaxID=3017813 RepID=A0ABT4ZCQ8_9RHOB|nr:precorrin-3B synthase [Paracoccus onchidii]MDB6177145.1 precorrin-3B synthase [Paracoccus onchidii]
MSAVRGWCPGALRPMESGDGLILRIKPRQGRLSAAQAAAVVTAARQYGHGKIELTSRANLQIRGITPDAYPKLLRGLQSAGLIDNDIAGETRRNIILSPFADAETRALAADLEARLTGCGLTLPAKFGFAIDCGPARVLTRDSADIRVERGETNGLILRADGCATGRALKDPDQIIELAQWFLDMGGAPDGRGRMKALIAKGIHPDNADMRPTAAAGPYMPGLTPHGRLIGLEFGQIDAAMLISLSQQADLRLTPWRMILVPATAQPGNATGLVMNGDDPRLRVHACTGAPGCPKGHAPTRDLARSLAPCLPADAVLHVSGCSKGCAWPRKADITLTATASGRFDLIRNGTASDPPAQHALMPHETRKAL